MAIKYSFVDNAIYGTEDVNAITKDLTGAGVAPFPTQDTYNTSDFNTLTEALVSTGTSLDGCKCTVTNAAAANMTVTVAQGVVFFESGVRLTVDGEGYVVPVTPGKAGYIFAHYNPALQVADILFDTALPTDGEYVLLAELAVNGTITDKRTFARSKVATFGRNVVFETAFTELETPIIESAEVNWYTVVTKKLENVDISKFNYALIEYGGREGIFDLNTGVFIAVFYPTDTHGIWGDAHFNTNLILDVSGSNFRMYIYKQDDTLVFKQEGRYTWDQGSGIPVNVKLI